VVVNEVDIFITIYIIRSRRLNDYSFRYHD